LLAAALAVRPRNSHAFAGTHPQQVDLDSANVARTLKNTLPVGPVGVVDLPAEGELDAARQGRRRSPARAVHSQKTIEKGSPLRRKVT
jgi:hypothetical protein